MLPVPSLYYFVGESNELILSREMEDLLNVIGLEVQHNFSYDVLNNFFLRNKCCVRVMINFADCTDMGCEAVFTNPELINEDTRDDLLIGLLQILRNSPRSVCPKSVSRISTWSS